MRAEQRSGNGACLHSGRAHRLSHQRRGDGGQHERGGLDLHLTAGGVSEGRWPSRVLSRGISPARARSSQQRLLRADEWLERAGGRTRGVAARPGLPRARRARRLKTSKIVTPSSSSAASRPPQPGAARPPSHLGQAGHRCGGDAAAGRASGLAAGRLQTCRAGGEHHGCSEDRDRRSIEVFRGARDRTPPCCVLGAPLPISLPGTRETAAVHCSRCGCSGAAWGERCDGLRLSPHMRRRPLRFQTSPLPACCEVSGDVGSPAALLAPGRSPHEWGTCGGALQGERALPSRKLLAAC